MKVCVCVCVCVCVYVCVCVCVCVCVHTSACARVCTCVLCAYVRACVCEYKHICIMRCVFTRAPGCIHKYVSETKKAAQHRKSTPSFSICTTYYYSQQDLRVVVSVGGLCVQAHTHVCAFEHMQAIKHL